MIQMDLFTEQKETQQKRTDLVNSDLEVTRGGGSGRRMWEGIVREFGMDMDTLLCLKWITSKDLLHSTGNSAQCYVAAWMGGEFGGEWIHVYILLSPFTVHLKLPNIVNWRCSDTK